jgi:DNA-binding NtrC family response regulator
VKSKIMNIDRPKMLATEGALASAGARVWVESISVGMRTVEAVIRELSQNDLPVLVVAEHGSGKAAAAARIHILSSRAAEPFQVLQAHEAAAETLAACDGQRGTIYLQEVGDLTTTAQKELVRQIALNGVDHSRVPRFICGTSRGSLLWNQRSLFAAPAFTPAERRHPSSARLVSVGRRA